jgi:hypothetical protein
MPQNPQRKGKGSILTQSLTGNFQEIAQGYQGIPRIAGLWVGQGNFNYIILGHVTNVF